MCLYLGNVCDRGEACINAIPNKADVIIDYSKFYYDTDTREFRPKEKPLVVSDSPDSVETKTTEKVNECKINQESKVQPDKVAAAAALVTNTKEPLSFDEE